MSTTLWWLPEVQPGLGMGHPLKGILAKKYFNQDGSLGSDGSVVLDEKDVPFLKEVGLELCDSLYAPAHSIGTYEMDKRAVKDCQDLLDAIKEYGSIIIWLE